MPAATRSRLPRCCLPWRCPCQWMKRLPWYPRARPRPGSRPIGISRATRRRLPPPRQSRLVHTHPSLPGRRFLPATWAIGRTDCHGRASAVTSVVKVKQINPSIFIHVSTPWLNHCACFLEIHHLDCFSPEQFINTTALHESKKWQLWISLFRVLWHN